MKTLYESLLDDEDDLLDNESTIIDGLLNPDTLLMSREVFYKKIKETSKKIKYKPEDIENNKVFQAKKIYVLFRPKYPEHIVLLYQPAANKINLCQMNTSYVRSGAHAGRYRWTVCKSYLKIVASWIKFDRTYEMYELPEEFYPLWDKVHKKINPNDDVFDIK
jgi:hypothetical protein